MVKSIKVSLCEMTFLSSCLGTQTHVNVLLPLGCATQNKEENKPPFKTLTLLHGKSDDYCTWLRNSTVEQLAQKYKLAVIMPDADNSFYTNMKYGARYFDYISEELPRVMRKIFPLSHRKEDNFIAGLSMGGYGAMKVGMRCHQNYRAIGFFSSLADVVGAAAKNCLSPEKERDFAFKPEQLAVFAENQVDPEKAKAQAILDNHLWKAAFGDDMSWLKGSDEDLFALAEKTKAEGNELFFYQTCGTDDFLYRDNLRLRDHIQKLGLDHVYEEGPGGHVWKVWEWSIHHYVELLHDRGYL